MDRVLISWIGRADLNAFDKNDPGSDPGPVLRFLKDDRGQGFQAIYLLNDVLPASAGFIDWLASNCNYPVDKFERVDSKDSLRNRIDQIWEFTIETAEKTKSRHSGASFAFLLSPGYPLAQAALMMVSETRFPSRSVELYNSSPQGGVELVDLPEGLSLSEIVGRKVQPGTITFDSILGSSQVLRAVKGLSALAAQLDSFSVLLTGEMGTGKDLFAQSIHNASSRVDSGKFIVVNCAAITESLAEGELFGILSDVATGVVARDGLVSEANKGTLFLDEVGLLPLPMQGKLLRLLENKTYRPVGATQERHADIRVIAATNSNLKKKVGEGEFLPDLYSRLKQFPIEVPPLKQRLEDIPELATTFLDQLNAELANVTAYTGPKEFDSAALESLQQYEWEENVRGLRNTVRLMAVISPVTMLTVESVVALRGNPDFSKGFGLPLSAMSPIAFCNHLAAVVDELLERYQSNDLPIARNDQAYDLEKEMLTPLLVGRACQLSKSDAEAGRLIRLTEGGRTVEFRGSYEDARQVYETRFMTPSLIDENEVTLTRQGFDE